MSKWQSRDEIAALVLPESPEMSLPHENHVPTLDNEETWVNVLISDELTMSQKGKVKDLLKEFSDVFSGKPNLTHVITTHRMTLVTHCPSILPLTRVPQKVEEEVNKDIEKMLQLGIIRPLTSPWASPVVIVPKPDGTIRLCVDYRKVNNITKMDAYPIPSRERMIEKVALAKYISKIDRPL